MRSAAISITVLSFLSVAMSAPVPKATGSSSLSSKAIAHNKLAAHNHDLALTKQRLQNNKYHADLNAKNIAKLNVKDGKLVAALNLNPGKAIPASVLKTLRADQKSIKGKTAAMNSQKKAAAGNVKHLNAINGKVMASGSSKPKGKAAKTSGGKTPKVTGAKSGSKVKKVAASNDKTQLPTTTSSTVAATSESPSVTPTVSTTATADADVTYSAAPTSA